MPNWCSNYIVIDGSKESITKISEVLDKVKNDSHNMGVFQSLVGVSKEGDDWYDNNVSSWGTKWDVSYDDCSFDIAETCITLSPVTAWGPPIQFLMSLAKQYDINAEIKYEEAGNDFCGIANIDSEGNIYEKIYRYLEGKYILYKDDFWEEMTLEAESLDEDVIVKDYVKENFPYVTNEDKKRIIKIFSALKE